MTCAVKHRDGVWEIINLIGHTKYPDELFLNYVTACGNRFNKRFMLVGHTRNGKCLYKEV